jgi:voltage-gated potassium channel Kch
MHELTEVKGSSDVVVVTPRVATLAGKFGGSTKSAVDARAGVVAAVFVRIFAHSSILIIALVLNKTYFFPHYKQVSIISSFGFEGYISYLELALIILDTPV